MSVLETLTAQHANLGHHLALIKHIQQETGIAPVVTTDGEGSHTATWWEGQVPQDVFTAREDGTGSAVCVATEFENHQTTTETYVYVSVAEGPAESVAALAAELAEAQTILDRVVRAAETHAMPPERHGERVS